MFFPLSFPWFVFLIDKDFLYLHVFGFLSRHLKAGYNYDLIAGGAYRSPKGQLFLAETLPDKKQDNQ